MSTVAELLDDISGLRDDAARALAEQYPDVASLAAATKADLQAVDGIGPVMANRVLEAARTHAVPATADTAETEQLPERMKSAIADAADAARPVLSVVEDDADAPAADGTAAPTATPEPATPARPTDRATEPQDETELSPVVARLAELVGAAAGWTVRIYRTVSGPAHRALGGLLRKARRA